MNHAFLSGTYEVTIDQKNRVPIGAEFRRTINLERDGDAFFIVMGPNGRLWIYPDRYYTALVSQRGVPQLIPDADMLEFDHMYFSSAYRRTMDDQGRILVPEKLLKRSRTGRDVAIVGIRDHLELWNRAEWDAWEEDLDNRRTDIAAKASRHKGLATQNAGEAESPKHEPTANIET